MRRRELRRLAALLKGGRMAWFTLPFQIALGIALAHYIERILTRLFG